MQVQLVYPLVLSQASFGRVTCRIQLISTLVAWNLKWPQTWKKLCATSHRQSVLSTLASTLILPDHRNHRCCQKGGRGATNKIFDSTKSVNKTLKNKPVWISSLPLPFGPEYGETEVNVLGMPLALEQDFRRAGKQTSPKANQGLNATFAVAWAGIPFEGVCWTFLKPVMVPTWIEHFILKIMSLSCSCCQVWSMQEMLPQLAGKPWWVSTPLWATPFSNNLPLRKGAAVDSWWKYSFCSKLLPEKLKPGRHLD